MLVDSKGGGIAFNGVACYIIFGKAVITVYQILENLKMMSAEEIEKTFDGKWVYIVKADITRHGELIKGIPVIVADAPFEGNEDGVYLQYRKPEYEERCAHNLKHYEPFVPSVFSVEFEQ